MSICLIRSTYLRNNAAWLFNTSTNEVQRQCNRLGIADTSLNSMFVCSSGGHQTIGQPIGWLLHALKRTNDSPPTTVSGTLKSLQALQTIFSCGASPMM